MTILTTIANGASMKDVRDTLNGILADVAALKAGTGTPAPTPVSISGTPPTTGQVGQAYSFTPATANGSGSKTFVLAAGTLLGGLSFNSSTGAITGTPTVAGTMSGLVVRVSDSTGSASTTATNVTIAAAAAALPQASKIAHTMFSEDIPAQADNTALTSWTDSKSGVQWTQTTASAQPKYRTNRFAGKPTVQFAGAQFIRANRAQAMIDTIGRAHTRMFIFSTIGGVNGIGAIFGANGANGFDGRVWDTVSTGNGIGSTNNTFPWTDIGFTTVIHNKQNSRTYINGSRVANGNGSSAYTSSNDFLLGAARDNVGDSYGFSGELLGVIIWDGAGLSQPEALQAHKWACDKYAQPYPWANITRFVAYVGDSLTNNLPGSAYPTLLAQSLALSCGTWANLGQDGAIVAASDPNNDGAIAAAEADPIPGVIGKPLLVTFMNYPNRSGNDATTNANQTAAFLADRKAANASTLTLVMTSTGMTADVDSGGAEAAFGTKRKSYNSLVMAQTANIDGKVDVSTDSRIGVVGSNRDGGDRTYFTDYTHLSAAGQTVFAGLIRSEVDRLRKIA